MPLARLGVTGVWAVLLSGSMGSLPNLGVSLSLGHGLAPFRPSVPFPGPTTSFWDSIRCWPTILGRLVGLLREKETQEAGQSDSRSRE